MRYLFCLMLLPLSSGALAQEPQPSSWHASVSLGYGEKQNPLIEQTDLPTWGSVNVSYFHRYWFFDSGDLGVTLVNNDWLTLNAIGTLNATSLYYEDPIFSAIDFNDFVAGGTVSMGDSATEVTGPTTSPGEVTDTPNLPSEDSEVVNPPAFDAQVFIEDRQLRLAVEAGAELMFELAMFDMQSQLLADISGAHNGYSLSLSAAYPINLGDVSVKLSADMQFHSANKNQYYWGAGDYWQAGSSLQTGVQLSGMWRFAKQWGLVAVVDYQHLGSIADSPLIDTDTLTSAYAGVLYQIR